MVDSEENEGGIRYIATAIRNDRGEVVAAIGISGPSDRMTRERIHSESKTKVMKTAVQICKRQGFKTGPLEKGGD